VLTLQVTYTALPVNNEQEQQAVEVLKGLAAQCLQVDPSSRPHAIDIQADLFDVMVANKWNNSLTDDCICM